MTADATQKKRRSSRKNTITVRWLISNLGVVFLVLLIVELSVIYTLQHYYYNSAEQYLTTKISSVTTVLTRYSQDTGSNFSADLRSTFENFSGCMAEIFTLTAMTRSPFCLPVHVPVSDSIAVS